MGRNDWPGRQCINLADASHKENTCKKVIRSTNRRDLRQQFLNEAVFVVQIRWQVIRSALFGPTWISVTCEGQKRKALDLVRFFAQLIRSVFIVCACKLNPASFLKYTTIFFFLSVCWATHFFLTWTWVRTFSDLTEAIALRKSISFNLIISKVASVPSRAIDLFQNLPFLQNILRTEA